MSTPKKTETAQQLEAAKELSRKQKWDREHVKYPFWFGGSASCFAACVTHPLDLGMLFLPLHEFPHEHLLTIGIYSQGMNFEPNVKRKENPR